MALHVSIYPSTYSDFVGLALASEDVADGSTSTIEITERGQYFIIRNSGSTARRYAVGTAPDVSATAINGTVTSAGDVILPGERIDVGGPDAFTELPVGAKVEDGAIF